MESGLQGTESATQLNRNIGSQLRWLTTPAADRWVALGLACLYFLLLIAQTKSLPRSWNDTSRVAAMESLVNRGTWMIDDSPWTDLTQDKVLLNGHYYSGKMPLLSWLGAGIYAGVKDTAGIELTPDCQTTARGCAYYWIALLLCGLPAAIMLGFFYLWGRTLGVSLLLGLLGTLTLGLATEFLPYSIVLDHHVPAAAALFIGFYVLLVLAPKNNRWLAASGFLASLATMCDPLAGIGAVALGLIALIRYRQGVVWMILGALPPLLVTMWLDLQITHTIIPPYLTPSGYNYEGAGAQRGPAGMGTPDDLPQYTFKMFLGAQGLFAYNPVLWFGIAGIAIAAIWNRKNLRLEAIILGAAFLGLCVYLATHTGNLGGNGYGERYFVNAIPIVMAFQFLSPPLAATRFRALFGALFALALALSLVTTYQGVRNPWSYIEPPLHITRDSQSGAIGIRWTWTLRLP